jgi:hypothetical protein
MRMREMPARAQFAFLNDDDAPRARGTTTHAPAPRDRDDATTD